MPNNLPRAAAVVFGFWLFVAVCYDWFYDLAYLSDFYSNIAITLRFALFGSVFGALFLISLRFSKRGVIFGVALRGLTPSIGSFNAPKAPTRADVLPSFPPEIIEWLANQRASNGAGEVRAALFEDIAAILCARAEVPATTVPGGHGGVSLLNHTMSVVVEALRRAASFQYRGLLYPDGNVAVPPLDPHYQFSSTDPLIPLVAIGHDIGKLECYALSDGTWTEVSHAHDSKGSVLLSRLDLFWALPDNERMLVQRAVGYYHHPLDIPINTGDRAFALIGLLNESDNAASRYEHHIRMDSATAKRVEPRLADIPDGDAPPPKTSLPSSSADIQDENQDVFEQRLLETFLSLLQEPERINGADQQLRVGFKFNEYLYLSEERVRQILADRLQAPRLATARMGGGRYVLSSKLAEILNTEGVLFRTHGKKTLAPNAALFKMKMTDPRTGREVTNWPAVFVLFAGKLGLSTLEDARFPVTSLEPRWGSRAGGNSAATISPPAPASSHGGNSAARDANTPVPNDRPSISPDLEGSAEPVLEGDNAHESTQQDTESPSASNTAPQSPRGVPPHVLLESAILGRASDGKTVDGVVYLRITDASQHSGLSVDEILALQQELALRGIVIRRGKGDVCWVGAPIEEKPDKGKR